MVYVSCGIFEDYSGHYGHYGDWDAFSEANVILMDVFPELMFMRYLTYKRTR